MAKLISSMESIDFQDGIFFKELTLAFSGMRSKSTKELEESSAAEKLIAIIHHHTNLNFAWQWAMFGPAVGGIEMDRNNVLINTYQKNFFTSTDGLRMIRAARETARGSVNLKTGLVKGIFEDLRPVIYYPPAMLKENSKYSNEELAGMVLHEIGHVFTYCEFMGRLVTTNQALAGMARALDDTDSVEQRVVVLKATKDALSLKNLDADSLGKTSDRTAIDFVVISNIIAETRSELGTNIYDLNSWEYLSDQYAARQGAGRYVVTALDKLYRGAFHISFRGTAAYVAMEALKFALIAGTFLFPSLAPLVTTLVTMDSMDDGTYDRPGARFQRIRNQLVEGLKERDLDKATKEIYLADLAAIDEILKRVKDRQQLLGLVWNLFSKASRQRLHQEEVAKELEQIAANDLFVRAATMKEPLIAG